MPLLLILSLPVAASHTWAEIDLCEVYKDTLPPGLTAESLPEAQAPGAALLNRYCTQCHNLPGPDRHTTVEWHDVASRMFMLMDVSNRFGGLMGRVDTMQPQDQKLLLAYLQRHSANSIVDYEPDTGGVDGHPWLTRSLALLPFLVLMGVGLLRWWRNFHNGTKSCVID
ncbi:MAG: hypothetical protein KZQ93_08835 [Candidatus Thiodiazotropha sp. (ex Monitilora ramsayi)]|nr:hypothetical protein [Candidatus Thiodiazotropha sp. (ex Monitilora ramsayi)]